MINKDKIYLDYIKKHPRCSDCTWYSITNYCSLKHIFPKEKHARKCKYYVPHKEIIYNCESKYTNYNLDIKVLKPNYPVYIVNKKNNLCGWVLIDYIDNKEKTIHCYCVFDGNLYDDLIKYDDYFFYDHEI